jgi:predicted dehydrogenase
MRILIAGLGSIGLRHLGNLRSLVPDAYIGVWRQATPAGDDVPEGVDEVVYDLESALAQKPDIALVTGPATAHIATGRALAERGIHLYIEKPLAHSLEGVDDLLALCRRNSAILMVGYNYRFNASLCAAREMVIAGRIGRVLGVRAEVGQYLPEWRPGQDYRDSVSARADLGGGVVLELSHEFDYIRWLVGEITAVNARLGKVSDLEIDVEDLAEVVLEFRDGAIGNIHLDMVQRIPVRTCRIIGSEGTLVWDGLAGEVKCYLSKSGTWSDASGGKGARNDMYLEALRHFLYCVEYGKTPESTGEDGRSALAIALAVKESARTGATVEI